MTVTGITIRKVFLYFISIASFIINCCDAQTKKRKSSSRRSSKEAQGDHLRGLFYIALIILILFVPPVFYFIYNVAKDPLTPELIQRVKELARDKTFGYLSARKKEAEKTN